MRRVTKRCVALGVLVLLGCPPHYPVAGTVPPSGAVAAPSSTPSVAQPARPARAVGPMTHEARLAALGEAWGSHHAGDVAAMYAADAVLKRPGRLDVRGREAIERSVADTMSASRDLVVLPGRVWAKDAHTAVLEWVRRGTDTGAGPRKGTNRPFGVVAAAWVLVGDDGLIKEEREYEDRPTVAGQLVPDKESPVRDVIDAPPREAAPPTTRRKVEGEEQRNLEVEERFTRDQNTGKLDDAFALVADGYTLVDYTADSDLHGKTAFREHLVEWMRAFPDLKATITASFADRDVVVMELAFTGVQRGALGSIKATHRPLDFHLLEVDQLEGGQLARSWAYGDSAEMLSELGVLAATEGAPGAK